MKIVALAAAAACAVAFALPAQAEYVINISQSGGDVVATGSGSINFNDLSFQSFDFDPSSVNASAGDLFLDGSAGYGDIYAGATGPGAFGTGGTFSASSTSGGTFASIGVIGANEIIIPGGYAPGQTMDPVTSTWSGQSLASMGLKSGTYVWSWGGDGNADSLTINIAGSVPEPSTWALMLLGFGLAGVAMRRRSGAVAAA